MATLTASEVLDALKLSSSDVDPEIVEVLIDDAIGEVNLRAGTSIGAMAGTAGSKTASMTVEEKVAVKLASMINVLNHIGLTLNPSASGGAVYGDTLTPFRDLRRRLEEAIDRLRDRGFVRG